jgi:hypothetical protein
MKKSYKHRDGDTFVNVTVELEPAVVQFSEILDAIRIEVDGDYDPLDGDTHAHELLDIPEVEVDWENVQAAVYTERRGHRRPGWCLIQLNDDPHDPGSCGAHGMSKQVRYEYAARVKAQLLKYIQDAYADRITGYGAVGNFRGFHASCWGFEPEEYAESEGRPEIASEIAEKMIDAGYTVVGYPPVETLEQKRQRIRDKVRRNLEDV